MKKFLIVLLVIALVLALAVGGAAGYFWFRNNHVFINGTPYPLDAAKLDLREEYISAQEYEQIQAELPRCDIVWNVLFQGHRISSDTRELNVAGLEAEDVEILRYFPRLETVNVSGENLDFALLRSLQAQRPDLSVNFQVSLGGSRSFDPAVTELTLEPGEYTLEGLTENLKYLNQVTAVTLKKVESQPVELEEAYPQVTFRYTVELLGQELDSETTSLDLSFLTGEDVEAMSGKLAMLPGLQTVELMNAGGESSLTMEDVKVLQAAAPQTAFHYTFDFFGETLSASDEEVHISNKNIGDEGLDEVRKALDIMGSCKRFVLENCKISNEKLAELREEYRGRTKIVWRVYFGKGGSCLTDREVIKAVYGLKDSNCMELQYCEDAKFCDFGHNETLNTCAFVAGMPNLEAIILSGSPIKDLEAFRNCKKLKFLEVAFCGYIKDVTPLAECTSLEMLNISATKVADITPVMDLPLTLLSAKNLKLSNESMKAFEEKHPECWTSFQREGTKVQPYGKGWRYDKNNKYLPYYEMLREVFDYDHPVNTTKW